MFEIIKIIIVSCQIMSSGAPTSVMEVTKKCQKIRTECAESLEKQLANRKDLSPETKKEIIIKDCIKK